MTNDDYEFASTRDPEYTPHASTGDAAREAQAAEDELHPYGPPCPCCCMTLGCYCHEYPHDKPECPGRVDADKDLTAAASYAAQIETPDGWALRDAADAFWTAEPTETPEPAEEDDTENPFADWHFYEPPSDAYYTPEPPSARLMCADGTERLFALAAEVGRGGGL